MKAMDGTRYLIAAALAVSFCAGSEAWAKRPNKRQAEYEATLQLWLGRTVDELMITYGVPSKSVDLPSGSKLLSFTGVKETGPSNLGSMLLGDKGAVLDSDTGSSYRCVVNFAVATDGLVKAAKIQHNDSTWGLIDPCGDLIKAP